jgi:tryptophan-rich sensory protein
LALLIGVAQAAGLVGSVFTRQSLDGWYRSLEKPSWTPSGRIIGTVWIVLYTLMGLAEYVAWRTEERRRPPTAYLGQLALNVGWSAVFFGLRAPGWALGEIALLWLGIAGWMLSLARVSRTAVGLAAPYLAWTTFAAVLNWAIWRRNR